MDAIHKILAPAVDRIPHFQFVFAVFGNLETKHWIRIEAEVIGIGDFSAFRIADFHDHLEPPRHGVRQIGNQGAGAAPHDQIRAAFGTEAELIDVAGLDLAVEGAGSGGNRDCLLFAPPPRLVRFAFHDLGHGTDLEAQRIGESPGTTEPKFAHAGFGIGGDLHFDPHHFAKLRVRLHAVAALEQRHPMFDAAEIQRS